MQIPTNNITALRELMFAELRSLGKDSTSEQLEVARQKNAIAQTIINSAKVEVDALRVIGGTGTGFIPPLPPQAPPEKTQADSKTDKGGITHPRPGVLVHRIR